MALSWAVWLMMKWLERRGRDKERRRFGGTKREETEDTEGEAETIRRMLSLHHYFNTHSPSADSSSPFFLWFALPLISSLYYSSSSLRASIISFYLSASPVFCCSDTQTNEPWNIRHRDAERVACECVWVAGFRACTSACAHVCVRVHFDFGFEGSPRRSGR